MTNLKNRLDPLTWQVAIATPDGRPTPEFMRKWAQQQQTNASIIDMSSAAAVSSAIDLISGVPGAMLYRAAGSWTVLPPSTAGYVLQTNGPGTGPSWVAKLAAASPTATASDAAVNGTAVTYMRSDAAPAVQLGSDTQKGVVQVDGTTITASGGVISASGGGGFATLTQSGQVCASGVATTVFTMTAGGLWAASVHDGRNFIAGALIAFDGVNSVVLVANGTDGNITSSGSAIQYTQGSGVSQTAVGTATLLAP